MDCGFCESALSDCVGKLLVDWVAKPVGRQFNYICCFRNNVEMLKERKDELISARARLQHEIEDADRRLLAIEDPVGGLVSKVDEILSNMETLENEIKQNKRFFNWCPDWIWRYRLSKKVTRNTLVICELLKKTTKFGQPGRVGYRSPGTISTIEFHLSKDFMASKSSETASKQIIEALQDDNVSMIGLWGMGGVGKTTLVHEVGTYAKRQNLFDKVAIATVSQKPNFETIQDAIAKDLDFDMKNDQGRISIQEFWLKLRKEKRILIILDDVWAKIDLKKDIGIPFSEDHEGSKILLTTRRLPICVAMDCQKTISLGCLDDHEAWNLFKAKAGLDNSSDEAFKHVASQVIKKCDGLPIAIVTLGSALKGKNHHRWEAAYWRLENRRLVDIEDMDQKNAYLVLEVSFDYLNDTETKMCFLLCSLFPEDYEINVEELVRYAWGLELCRGMGSIEAVRRVVLAAMGSLKDSCLLLNCGERHVKMHDMVRDVALWIASRRKEFSFMIKSEVVEMWPKDESFEPYEAVSFKTSRIVELPKGLVCPNLKILLLGGDGNMITSIEFFEGMKALRACTLNSRLISPDAFQFQTNLRTLHLESCKLLDISVLGKLKKLEVLSFSWSDIKELQEDIGDLDNLKLLDLSYCEQLQRIPPQLMRRLSQLEELYLHGCPLLEWATENTVQEDSFASLSELNSLSNLIILSLEVCSEDIPRDFVFCKLQRFYVCVGFGFSDFHQRKMDSEICPFSRSLNIEWSVIEACKQLFGDTESLNLKNVVGCQNLVPSLEWGQAVFGKLTYLGLESCEHMKCLIDTRKQQVLTNVFPNLLELSLTNMRGLEELCSGHQPQGFLLKLKTLMIDQCRDMTCAIPTPQSLERLEVESCDEMQVLFQIAELRSIQEGPSHQVSLQSLKVVRIHNCNKLRYLFPTSVAKSLGQLEKLKLSSCLELEEIIPKTEVSNINLQSPRKVHVSGCNNLTSLSSLSHGQSLEKLTTLTIRDCSRLEYTFPISMAEGLPQLNKVTLEGLPEFKGRDGNDVLLTLPSLQELEMRECIQFIISAEIQIAELRSIQQGPSHHVSLQSLKVVRIHNCNKLRYLFPTSVAESLGQLETLNISSCLELEEIIPKTEVSNINLQSLSEVYVRGCNSMTSLSSLSHGQILEKLTTIEIRDCSRLEYTFPISMAEDLPQLHKVTLCGLPAFKGRDGNDIVLTLPSLQALEMRECPQFIISAKIQIAELRSIQEGPSHHVSLQSLKVVTIVNCNKLRYLFPTSVAKSLGQLETLNITDCLELEEIIPKTEVSNINLQSLWAVFVSGCSNLTSLSSLSHGQSLESLTTLEIRDCSRLEYTFPISMAEGLPQLNEVTLERLPELKGRDGNDIVLTLPSLQELCMEDCPQLTPCIISAKIQIAELRSIQQGPRHHVSLQSLKVVTIQNCNKLRYLFPTSVAEILGQLETLNIYDCSELEEIIPKTEVSNINLQSLREVFVSGCNNLTSLSSLSHGQSLESLTTLEIRDCSRLEYTFPISMAEGLPQLNKVTLKRLPEFKGRDGNDIVLTLPSLQELKMKECPQFIILAKIQIAELRSIQQGPRHHVSLQSLKVVTIQNCNKLRYLFPTSVAEILGQLETLNIYDCSELEEIIPKTEVSNINLQSLREVFVSGCNNLTSLSSLSHGQSLESLTTLEIRDCSRLEYTFPISMAEGLPQLNKVTLKRLPEFKGRDGNDIVLTLPSLQELKMKECPQFIILAKIQ
ncbi:uncharacterized protein LOC111295799, partial [Durio zibethinus]|uniref:Uncharacterized protein LOC111295799 n=1 Tax=Durio zibethinus TaxID=66656 RepID=A0A6P5YXS9_DURZI